MIMWICTAPTERLVKTETASLVWRIKLPSRINLQVYTLTLTQAQTSHLPTNSRLWLKKTKKSRTLWTCFSRNLPVKSWSLLKEKRSLTTLEKVTPCKPPIIMIFQLLSCLADTPVGQLIQKKPWRTRATVSQTSLKVQETKTLLCNQTFLTTWGTSRSSFPARSRSEVPIRILEQVKTQALLQWW